MFEALPPAEPDRIIALMGQFREDPRADKIDLGVGVYRDAAGATPIFGAIRQADARLSAAETTRSYVGLAGDPAVVRTLGGRVLGEGRMERTAGCQSVGGTGALFMLARLARLARPDARAHVPRPTWPNHVNILGAAGLPVAEYPYLDAAGRDLDFEAMAGALDRLGPGDVVILHACCHNPSGSDPSQAQWARLAEIAARRGWMPMFDVAYPGFGAGWDADCAGLRLMADAVPETMAAVSGSKTFGLYRDRAGVALAAVADPAARARAQETLAALNRNIHSMPPWRGGELIRIVLSDPALAADWQAELDAMRARIAGNRRALAEALARRPGGQGWSFIGDQRGMFTLLGLTEAQVTRLREDHAVYVVPGGRINVAGLADGQAEAFADALLAVV